MFRLFRSLEAWASQSDERARLLVIFVWLAFGVIVTGTTLVAAELILPPEWRPI